LVIRHGNTLLNAGADASKNPTQLRAGNSARYCNFASGSEAREIAKAEAHAVAISEGGGDEPEYTRISEATFAKVYAETLLSGRRVKTTPRSPRSRK